MTPESNDDFAIIIQIPDLVIPEPADHDAIRYPEDDGVPMMADDGISTIMGELTFVGGAEDYAIQYPEKAKAPCMGRVEIKAIVDDPGSPDHGKVVAHISSNTITFDARGIMARALAGLAEAKITTVGWGSGNTPPARSNTQLENELITSGVIEPAGFPTPDSVVFSSTLAPNVGTGQTYTEVGLKSAGGDLFARFTFPPQEKFPRLRLSVNWQIIFI